MRSLLVFVLLAAAAAATAAVVSNDNPDVGEVLELGHGGQEADGVEAADGDETADVDVKEMSEEVLTDVAELTDLFELSDESDLPPQTAVATRRNLSQGSIGAADRLAFNGEYRAKGIAGHVHVREIRVPTNGGWITAIRVTRVGASQNATPSILSGGIGYSSVTIRIWSDRGRGYHYRIQVYVRQ